MDGKEAISMHWQPPGSGFDFFRDIKSHHHAIKRKIEEQFDENQADGLKINGY